MSVVESPDVDLMGSLFSFSGDLVPEVNEIFIRECSMLSRTGVYYL